MQPPKLRIEIVYALPAEARVLIASVVSGATVADAVNQAALSAEFAGLDLANARVGIFGRIVARDQLLKQGDRVEIYRPLAVDPKTARKKRLASKSGRS